MDNFTIASLRDAIRANIDENRKLREELHIANLLKLLELGFVNKNTVLYDKTYLEYKSKLEVCEKTKVIKK